MKKLLIFPVLGLAFFPLLTSAQSSDSPLCQDCLSSSSEYLICVGGEQCESVLDWESCYEFETCSSEYGDFSICEDDYDMCIDGGGSAISCQTERQKCYNRITSSYNSCVSSCQVNNCGAGICLPSAGGEGGDSGNGGEGSSPIVGGVLDGTQLSNMGSALVTGGSGLLHILIQLLPYAIALTIIFICFRLIANRTNFRTRDNGKSKFGRKYDDFMYEQYMDSYKGRRDQYYIPSYDLTEEEASKRSTKRKMRKEYKKRRKEHGFKWYQGRI